MPRGKNNVFCRNLSTVYRNGAHFAVFYADIRNRRQKMHLSAKGDYFFTDVFYYVAKSVSSDMRFCFYKNFFRRAVTFKLLKHKVAARVIYPCGKLSVAEGARSSLAELYVCIGAQFSAAPIFFHGCGAFVNLSAAFKYNRFCAGAGKIKPRKHSRGAETDYNGSCFRRLFKRGYFIRSNLAKGDIFCFFSFKNLFFFVAAYRNGAHKLHIILVTRIYGDF